VQGEVRSVWWIGVVGLRSWYAKDQTARQGGVSATETLSSGGGERERGTCMRGGYGAGGEKRESVVGAVSAVCVSHTHTHIY